MLGFGAPIRSMGQSMASFTGEPMTNHRTICASRRADRAGVRDLAGRWRLSGIRRSTAPAAGASRSVMAASSGQPPSNRSSGTAPTSASRTGLLRRTAIRNRVLNTINSTWGRYSVDGRGAPRQDHMTTWSFNDWASGTRWSRPRSAASRSGSSPRSRSTRGSTTSPGSLAAGRPSTSSSTRTGRGANAHIIARAVQWCVPRLRWHHPLQVLPLRRRGQLPPAATSWCRRR